MENIDEYLFNMIKDNIERKIYLNPNIVADVDETPLVLEEFTGTTIEKKRQKTITINTFWKSKERVSYILCIFENGMKASSILLFDDVPENHLENKLNKIKVVLEKKIYVTCQQNA